MRLVVDDTCAWPLEQGGSLGHMELVGGHDLFELFVHSSKLSLGFLEAQLDLPLRNSMSAQLVGYSGLGTLDFLSCTGIGFLEGIGFSLFDGFEERRILFLLLFREASHLINVLG